MKTTFTRLGDRRAGAASHIAIQELGFFSLTAVRTGSGDLKLINWETGDQSEVKRLAEASAGEVSEIALTRNLNRTVTAVRDGSGDLLLISWDDGVGEGPISRLKDTDGAAGAASLIDIQPVLSGTVANLVTSVRTGAGNLKLITWQLNSVDGDLTRLGDSRDQAGEVGVIAASVQHNVVVTAVRTGSGTLKLIAWKVSEDGKTVDRKAEAEAGEVSEIAMAGMVTAVRTASGKLKLISWRLSVDGEQIFIQRLHDHTAGKATRMRSRVPTRPGSSRQ
jgi:hypothetical protein